MVAERSSTLALFLPAFFSAIGSFTYENEKLTSELLLGGALICAANVIIQLKRAEPSLDEPAGAG
ncbi:MAG: hypothetical protein ACREIA_03615 [Opitutaceae bacterium]